MDLKPGLLDTLTTELSHPTIEHICGGIWVSKNELVDVTQINFIGTKTLERVDAAVEGT